MALEQPPVTDLLPPGSPPTALKRGREKKARPRPDHCLNCGTPATGKFCAECGQESKDHTVALRPLLADLLAEVASWDSKLLRTLVPLVIRPGFLTNEYNAGRRAPYLSPLKLYLTVSVLFFLVLAWKHPAANVQVEPGGVTIGKIRGISARPAPTTAAEYDAAQKALPPAQRDAPFNQVMARHAYKAKQSPQGFISALLNDIPKMMFFLLPLFAAVLKLMYWRKRRLYVEHLIFLLHVHAFAFLVLTPLLLIHPAWLVGCVSLALLVYVFVALRVVYKQGWIKTSVKFFLLGTGYVVLLSLCIAGTAMAALWLL